MADNTVRNITSGGDTIRTIDRGTAKTEVVQLDVGGEAGPESLVTTVNRLPIVNDPNTVAAFLSFESYNRVNAQISLLQLQLQAVPPNGFIPMEIPTFLIGGIG
jgi:hypothetical protein